MKDDGASLIEAHAGTPASRGQFGVFEVERLLGEGAFSEVYLARKPGDSASVAIKVLREDVDPRVKEQVRLRFLSEERIAKHIGHRAVVDVIETGCTPGGRFFIVMEYVDGRPFGEYFEERARAEEASSSPLGRERLLFELARIGHQVAEAMASAHQRSVVHRDLKSENVLVTTPNDGGELPRARILDFGIAKAPADVFSVAQARSFTRYFTDLGTVMGSPPYMAPEQNGAAHAVTGKADVFALGVMLFIAALRLDHRAIEAFQQPLVLPDDFERLVNAGPPLPKAWRELLRSMLRLEADARPSMREVALRLQRLARPDVEFAVAVDRFTRKAELPSARRLCALAARMEREAYLTDDERSFLRAAPIEKLRRGSSPLTGVALLAITGTLCFAAGSLGALPGFSLRSLSAVMTPVLEPKPAPNLTAVVQPRADEEKQRLAAELERFNDATMAEQHADVASQQAAFRSDLHNLLWWSLLLGIIIAIVGLAVFGGFAKGKWY